QRMSAVDAQLLRNPLLTGSRHGRVKTCARAAKGRSESACGQRCWRANIEPLRYDFCRAMTAVNVIGSYNYALVTLSVLIAVFASYVALNLASRVTAASGWTRAVWLLGGAAAMGTGIW